MTQRPLSPEEKMQHSYMLGKGLYSTLQLKNMLTAPGAQEEEEKFVIRIPKERLQQVKKSSFEEHILSIGQGLKGFKDKQDSHYKSKKNDLQKQLDEAQDRYLKSLMQSKQASLEKEATPHVDALCLGMLSILEKKAQETISDGSLSRSLKNLAHPLTKHLPTPHGIKENLIDKPLAISTLAALLLKSNINKEEGSTNRSPINVQIKAI